MTIRFKLETGTVRTQAGTYLKDGENTTWIAVTKTLHSPRNSSTDVREKGQTAVHSIQNTDSVIALSTDQPLELNFTKNL